MQLSPDNRLVSLANINWEDHVPLPNQGALSAVSVASQNSIETDLENLDRVVVLFAPLSTPCDEKTVKAARLVLKNCNRFITESESAIASVGKSVDSIRAKFFPSEETESSLSKGTESDVAEFFLMLDKGQCLRFPEWYKPLLAGESPYFRSIFFEEYAEKDQKKISIKEVDLESLKKILDVFIKGELGDEQIELPIEELLELISLGERLTMKSVIAKLSEILVDFVGTLWPSLHWETITKIAEKTQSLVMNNSQFHAKLNKILVEDVFANRISSSKNEITYLRELFATGRYDEIVLPGRRGYDASLLPNQLYQICRIWPNLRSLDLSNCTELENESVRRIEALGNLTRLNLSNCDNRGFTTASGIGNLRSLTSLNLSSCTWVTELDSVVDLANLIDLKLDDCSFLNGNWLQNANMLTKLEFLSLNGCHRIAGEQLKKVALIKSLTNLDLYYTQLTSIVFEELSRLQNLRVLSCSPSKKNDNYFKLSALVKMTSLNNFKLQAEIQELDKIAEWPANHNLRVLNLSRCGVLSPDHLKAIEKMKRLQEINFSHIPDIWGINLVRGISGLPNLEVLDLSSVKELNNVTLERIVDKFHGTLRILRIAKGMFDDEGIQSLLPLRALLTELNIRGNMSVTVKSISYLAQFLKLETLDISEAWKLKDQRLTEFQSLVHLKTLDCSMSPGAHNARDFIDARGKLNPDLRIYVGYFDKFGNIGGHEFL